MRQDYFLSPSAKVLINIFEQVEKEGDDDKIVVNRLISKIASFYEKFRTAMDYGSEETIPRRAIERMLNRMLVLEQDSKELSKHLLRELVWAGYLPNATVPESIINDVSNSISLYLKLKERIATKKIMKAVTDSGTEIKSGTDKPALTNLLTIYSLLTNRPIKDIEKEYTGQGYGAFKKGLAEIVGEFIFEFQKKFESYDDAQVKEILAKGANKARAIALQKMTTVKQKIGINY